MTYYLGFVIAIAVERPNERPTEKKNHQQSEFIQTNALMKYVLSLMHFAYTINKTTVEKKKTKQETKILRASAFIKFNDQIMWS